MYTYVRLTKDKIPHWTDELYSSVLKYLYEILDRQRVAIAYEEYNEFGDRTHGHYHIHIEHSNLVKKDSIQKHFNRKLGIKGNPMYACNTFNELEDPDRWFMYTFKENNIFCEGFTEEEIEEYTLLGKAEYERTKLFKLASREKEEAKNNFRNKMFRHISLNPAIISSKDCWLAIAKYYQEKHTTPPFKKLDDVVRDYQVHIGFLTLEQVYDFQHP